MTNIDQQIRASVQNGLSRPAIEALIGRQLTPGEIQTYRKAKAVYDLQLRKRRSERKYEHLSNTELKRKHDDKKASIDNMLDEAHDKIDWERREYAHKSLGNFIRTYLMDSLFETEPSKNMELAMAEMFRCLTDSRPYNIELPRGCGKTTVSEAMILYLIAYGHRKFCVIVSANARQAQNILKDIYRVIGEKDTPFAQDFPDICVPFIACNGFTRRVQKYGGRVIEMEKTASSIVLPRIIRGGKEVPTSGSVITTRGITAGLRGTKVGKLRPDLCLLDDIQTAESASSPDQVSKLLDLIHKDVMNLSSKGKLSVLMTSTPICPEDLCETIENDVNWKTTKFPAIISYPKDIQENGNDGLWGRYFQIYDQESMTDQPHDESLKFYRDNFDEMNEGSDIFASRYKESDGHISGIQALLERRHLIGESAFEAEMQMKPKKTQFNLDISPKIVLQRIGKTNRLVVPDGYIYTAASTDLNVSYALTTAIVAFKKDMSSIVIFHDIQRCRIDQKLPDAEYNRRVYGELEKLGKRLKATGVKIDGWGIDAGGRNWDAVCQFAKNSLNLVGVSACAMAGRASHLFNPLIRSRLRDAIGRTVLCGDAMEQTRAGSGTKYMFFDSDLYREMAQRAFLAPLGSQGGGQLYDGTTMEHGEFAQQFTNERLRAVEHKQDGRNIYQWQTSEPHDFGDCMSMSYAIAASQGISGEVKVVKMRNGIPFRRKHMGKRNVKIV